MTKASGILLMFLSLAGVAAETPQAAPWRVYIANDNCPDYTWGLDEADTRRALAELVRAHLDEMNRTDSEPAEIRNRYNMAVTQEAFCFLERYPARKDELIRRIREGRVYVSPFLNNTMWGFQSVESAIRSFYPARRLEQAWGLPMEVAHHIELPSLPWGMASILAGCGMRWLSVPFYVYDSDFKKLETPPLFVFEGPDGGRVRVWMDAWSSLRAHYVQGGRFLKDARVMDGDGSPDLTLFEKEWRPAYERLGAAYPLRSILASGTHSDISLRSAAQAPVFSEAIRRFNRGSQDPRAVNAAVPDFLREVDAAERRAPFLPTVRGDFGHTWELWPVSLAAYVARMREGERRYVAAEALLAAAGAADAELSSRTRGRRERAEWNWTMLADHAWNGTGPANLNENARLRREWSGALLNAAADLEEKGWLALGLRPAADTVTLFNSLNAPRSELLRLPGAAGAGQIVEEDGERVLYAMSPETPGLGFAAMRLGGAPARGVLRATSNELDGPYFRVKVDSATGGLASAFSKTLGRELARGGGRSVGQTVYFDGREHPLEHVRSEIAAEGPVLARLRITGYTEGMTVVSYVSIYQARDLLDFDIRIRKPVDGRKHRVTHVFPVVPEGAVQRIETTGAVIRPRRQPEGDLLPGAGEGRFAVQGFVDASLPQGYGVTIAPLDAFALRTDLEPFTFEPLGTDQNYAEVNRAQDGVTAFRFRYSLRAHTGPYDGAEAFAWSRAVATPLLARAGVLPEKAVTPGAVVDPRRALVLAFKPAEGDGALLRVQETAGRAGPLAIELRGYRGAWRTDLLERDLEPLEIRGGRIEVPLAAYGFAAVRLTAGAAATAARKR